MTVESEAKPANRAVVLGDPATGGVALLTVVLLVLGLAFTGIIPGTAIPLTVPILLMAGYGQLRLGLLAIAKGDNIIGLFFAVFGPFLIAFSLLIEGLPRGWFPVPAKDIPHAQAGFLLAWTIMITLYLLLSIFLPAIFTAILVPVTVGLWLLVFGIWGSVPGLEKDAGWILLLAAVGGLYFVASSWLTWVGHDVLPHGRPLVPARSATTQA